MTAIATFQQIIAQNEKEARLLFSSEVLSGLSGHKLMATLQGLAATFNDASRYCYVEIGVFQGLTLLSVAGANPALPCFGIDNFQTHDPDKKNFNIVQERMKKLGISNANLINMDYEDALLSLPEHIGDRKIGVFFIDGPHDYRSQLMCLMLAMPHLAKNAIILIDDSNYLQVRQANADFLMTHPEYKLLFEAYTPCHPNNMTASELAYARQGWWNGLHIIVRDKDHELPVMYPPVRRNRLLFENDHFVHASRIGAIAPQVLTTANLLLSGRLLRGAKNILKTWQAYRKSGFRGVFDDTNIFAEGLPTTRLNR
jgi:hypothetical protein